MVSPSMNKQEGLVIIQPGGFKNTVGIARTLDGMELLGSGWARAMGISSS